MQQPKHFDEIIQWLQHAQSWHVPQFNADGHPEPWMEWHQSKVICDLVINPSDLQSQVEALPAQVQFWGRMVATCERAVTYHERRFRVWKSQRYYHYRSSEGKKPTEKEIEAKYRSEKDYESHQLKIDQAKEALAASKACYEGFRSKRELVRGNIKRSIDDGQPRLFF